MERLLTRRLVTGLTDFDGGGSLVTSAYLGIEPSVDFRKTVLVRFKDLVAEQAGDAFSGLTAAQRAAVDADIEKISEFLADMRKVDISGLAVFACGAKTFFETIGIPAAFRPELIVSRRPAVAPLVAALEDYKRIAVCVLDRRKGTLYEYFMGRREETGAFSDDVPGRVRVGGWAGWQETKITRNIERQELVHLKNAAEVLFEQFKIRGFEWLFLAARGDLREAFEGTLHTYVRDRLKGYLDINMTTGIDEIRQKTMELAESLKAADNLTMVDEMIRTANAGGPAVVGLKNTLDAINRHAVHTLVLRAGLSHKGAYCGDCGTFGIRRNGCFECGKKMTQVDNIIYGAEEAAVARGATIKVLKTPSELDRFDGIGAVTRFSLRGANA